METTCGIPDLKVARWASRKLRSSSLAHVSEVIGLGCKVIILLSRDGNMSALPLFFTPSQANELLPEVEGILTKIIQTKKNAEKLNDDAEMADAMQTLKREIKKLEDLGCVLKDLNIGLIDFPAVRLRDRVWLCWKLGEDVVGFWHGLHEGYAARKAVKDDEFYQDDLALKALTG